MRAARTVLLAGAAAYFVAALLFMASGTPRDSSGFAAGSIFNPPGPAIGTSIEYTRSAPSSIAVCSSPNSARIPNGSVGQR